MINKDGRDHLCDFGGVKIKESLFLGDTSAALVC